MQGLEWARKKQVSKLGMVVSSLDVLSGERGAALTHSHATHFRGDAALTRFGRLQSDAFALKIRRMPLAKTLYERSDASTKILRRFFRYEGSHHLWRAWLKRVRVPTECGESGPPRLAIARSVSRMAMLLVLLVLLRTVKGKTVIYCGGGKHRYCQLDERSSRYYSLVERTYA